MRQKQNLRNAGSFFNYLMSNNNSTPVVGEWATEMLYTDRRVYKIAEVSKDMKQVKLECCHTSSAKPNEPMGHQDWIHEPNGYFITLVYRYGAWYVKSIDEWDNRVIYKKISILFGVCNYHYDWSF